MLTLYKGFKYDNRYDYIKTFNTKEDQDAYFSSLEKIYCDDYDYIREYEPFRVELSHAYLTTNGINYLKFNNGYKDMYAFIISKNYINDDVTELVIEIDVIQTFMFDIDIKKSFIERKVCNINEISEFDEGLNIGEHIITETHNCITKDYNYFAMFNGIKEQQILLNENGKITNIMDLPYPTGKPLSVISNIQYPLYFMPLSQVYAEPIITRIELDTGNDNTGVVASARKLLGKPYIWGGNYPPLGNSEGTDCSGLIMWAYNDNNLLLKVQQNIGLSGRWTTYSIIEHATYIDINKAKPGDVILCNFSSPGVPEHVQLVADVSGNNITVIEARGVEYGIVERTIYFNPDTMEIRRLL